MKFTFTILCTFLVFYTTAQRCSVSDYQTGNQVNSPFGPSDSSPKTTGRDTLKDEVIVIPVVVHVLYNNNEQNISTQQVLSQIDALNKDYRRLNADAVNTPAPFKNVAADTRIVFCLAKVDPQGRYTTGIIRKYTKESSFLADDAVKFSSSGGDDAWDATKYLNIWVCNLFGRTLGYGVLPGSPAKKDGVVIKYSVFGTTGNVSAPYNKGRTATHEIGHWLGLRHLWGDKNCGDDGIDDTPQQQAGNVYCPSFPHVSSCSVNGFGDMFMNYMDLTDDACMNMFTQGQKNAMRGIFAIGNPRNSFLYSSVCDSSNAQEGPLPQEEIAGDPLITTFPNPFNKELIISSRNMADIAGKILKLYNTTGKLITSQIIQSSKTILHLNNLPAGLYFLKIEGGIKPVIYKVVKQSP